MFMHNILFHRKPLAWNLKNPWKGKSLKSQIWMVAFDASSVSYGNNMTNIVTFDERNWRLKMKLSFGRKKAIMYDM